MFSSNYKFRRVILKSKYENASCLTLSFSSDRGRARAEERRGRGRRVVVYKKKLFPPLQHVEFILRRMSSFQ